MRIIPARAGFTPCHQGKRVGEWDHPRSRGVYDGEGTAGNVYAGSSPLARGLRASAGWGRDKARIIPARAGFTDAVFT